MKLKTSGGQLKLSAKAARAQTLALSPAQKQTALWCRCKRSGRRRRRRVRCQKVNPRFCAAAAARCVCDRFLVNIAHWGRPSKQNNSRHRAISHRFEPYKKAVSCMRNAHAVAKRSLQSQTSCLPAGFIAPEILNRDREDARGAFFSCFLRADFLSDRRRLICQGLEISFACGMLRDRLAMAIAVACSDLCTPNAVFATPYSMIQRGCTSHARNRHSHSIQ